MPPLTPVNTVLDDNKKLCLTSGEIIQLSNVMSLVFEVRDLAAASPATVSRCGMIYMEPQRLGWRPLMTSWLKRVAVGEDQRKMLQSWFEWLVAPLLQFVRSECVELSYNSDTGLVNSLMNMIDSVVHFFTKGEPVQHTARIIEGVFLLSTVWSLGASVNEAGRAKFDAFLRKLVNNEVSTCPRPESVLSELAWPAAGTIYDYVFEKTNGGTWRLWLDTIPAEPDIPSKAKYNDIIVPTVDTARYSYLMKVLIEKEKHAIYIGPTGTLRFSMRNTRLMRTSLCTQAPVRHSTSLTPS